jgi:hypothetical protein
MLDMEMECSACNWTDPNLAGMYFWEHGSSVFLPPSFISASASRSAAKEAGCRFDLRPFPT